MGKSSKQTATMKDRAHRVSRRSSPRKVHRNDNDGNEKDLSMPKMRQHHKFDEYYDQLVVYKSKKK